MSIIINGSNTPTAGSAAIGNGTELAFTAAGTSGQVLTSNGASAPTWGSAGGTGTVTSASIASANGFAGSVATATTTPAITLSTSITGVLKGNGTAISAATAGTDYVVPTSPTLTSATITGLIETKTAPTISSGTLTLNCSLGNVFQVALNAAITTLTISNIPTTGNAFGITLAFTMDGTARAVTWGASIKWSGGTAPTLTSTNNKVDIFVLTTWDGGTTWFAMVGGQNF
jgi:hypothetical protein